MNLNFKRIPIEKTLFFDIETVRANKTLDVDSKEFDLYRKKIRDKNTDELPSVEDTLEDYNRRAALKMGYSTIVTIGVGYVRAGDAFIKHLSGTEEEILKEFLVIASKFDYICGVNILGYDLPFIYTNASKYFDFTEIIPDRFVTSGKKPWELKNIVDLLEVIRGTHYANMSLDEMLYHYDLDSSKDDIDGSMVSNEYYTNGINKIIPYVKKDVFATMNLFLKMQFQKPFTDFVDRSPIDNSGSSTKEVEKDGGDFNEINLLELLYSTNYLSDTVKKGIVKRLEGKKLTAKDKSYLQDLLENIYIRSEFMDTDNADVVQAKKAEISDFIKNIKK